VGIAGLWRRCASIVSLSAKFSAIDSGMVLTRYQRKLLPSTCSPFLSSKGRLSKNASLSPSPPAGTRISSTSKNNAAVATASYNPASGSMYW